MIHGSHRPQAHLLRLYRSSESGEYLTLGTGNVYRRMSFASNGRRKTSFRRNILNARQTDNESGGHGALFGGSQVDFDGAPLLSKVTAARSAAEPLHSLDSKKKKSSN